MASLVKQFSGRKRQSNVWNHFEDRPDIGKCRCIIVKPDGKPCHAYVNGKNATNMKTHLQSHHEEVYLEVKNKDADTKQQAAATKRINTESE